MTCTEEASRSAAEFDQARAPAPRGSSSALSPGATSRRRPVAGVNGTDDLQLGVIAAAGALVGFGPAGIEHVFAARVGFQIAGHDAEHAPSSVSATRCCGCQPVRAVAEPEASSADRKACEMNGL